MENWILLPSSSKNYFSVSKKGSNLLVEKCNFVTTSFQCFKFLQEQDKKGKGKRREILIKYNMVLIYRPLIFWVAVCIHLTMGKEVRWNFQLSIWGKEWQCDPSLRTTWNSEYWTMDTSPRPHLSPRTDSPVHATSDRQLEAISLEKLTQTKEKASEYNVEGGRNGKWKSFDAPLTVQWSPLLKSLTNAQRSSS